jgi:hypothetical protein
MAAHDLAQGLGVAELSLGANLNVYLHLDRAVIDGMFDAAPLAGSSSMSAPLFWRARANDRLPETSVATSTVSS